MKIYLDLLPQQIKKEIHRSKRFKQIMLQEGFVLFVVIVFIVILFSINFILEIQRDSIALQNISQQTNENYQKLRDYENTFSGINTKIENLIKIKKNHFAWSGVLIKVSEITSKDVTISNFYTKNYQIFVVGKAKTREALLAYKDAIAADSCFEGVNVPLSNLVNKDDVDFQMDFTVKKECLLDKQNQK